MVEYWAEGVQSWFDTNRENDHEHNHVSTRAELERYAPNLPALTEKTLCDNPWRYVPVASRKDPGHLKGYDRTGAPTFAWPERLRKMKVRDWP